VITVSITLDDYISAHRIHHSRMRTAMYVASGIVVAVGAAGAALGIKTWPLIAICGGVGGVLGQWWEDRIGLPNKVRKLYDQFKGITEPATISWDSEWIEGRGERGHGKRKWKEYLRLKENDDVFLLYVTDQLWDAVPKRCFANQAQIEEFRRYASVAGDT
jgi:hypothetical protein